MDKKLDSFDRKLETQIADLKSEVRLVRTELEAKIDLSRTELEVKIAELSGKMDSYGKRLDQQEFVSRGSVLALAVGVTSGFIKYLFFSN